MGPWLLSLGFGFQEGYEFQDFLVLEQQSLRHVDCNNKKTLPFSWFHFLPMILVKTLFTQIWFYSLFNLFDRFWCLALPFKAFVAAKLVSINRFGTLLWEHKYVNFSFPFWHGSKKLNLLWKWNIMVLYLLCRKFCHYDMSMGDVKFLHVLSGIVLFWR